MRAVFSHGWGMLGHSQEMEQGSACFCRCCRFGVALMRIKEIWAFAGLGSDSEKENTSSVAHGGHFVFLCISPVFPVQFPIAHSLLLCVTRGPSASQAWASCRGGRTASCSQPALQRGFPLGIWGLRDPAAAPGKLIEKPELPSSASPSASSPPDQDSRFQETPSLSGRNEFTGTKRPEPSWGFGLLPWRENWGGLHSPEL